MKCPKTPGTSAGLALNLLLAVSGALSGAAESANGSSRVATVNPRYFTDGSGKAIYLTGSHTWANKAQASGNKAAAATEPNGTVWLPEAGPASLKSAVVKENVTDRDGP